MQAAAGGAARPTFAAKSAQPAVAEPSSALALATATPAPTPSLAPALALARAIRAAGRGLPSRAAGCLRVRHGVESGP